MEKSILLKEIPNTFCGFSQDQVKQINGKGLEYKQGKVRELIFDKDSVIITTTDRISAFDRVLTTIPFKGEVLNLMALYGFEKCTNIVDNHLIESISGRSIRVKRCDVLPVEVVVRGYLTGSAWRDYSAGKAVSGITLPAGMKNNQKFDKPLLTPSTKEDAGKHDQPISRKEIVASGLVEKSVWEQVEEVSMAIFNKGTEYAAKQGLILVDTKYEFGLYNGKLCLIDEVHTPDSSRFWFADTYQQLFDNGEDQRKLDKEYLRQWLMDKGFMGDGQAPLIPDEVRCEVANRYLSAYETITGKPLEPQAIGPQKEADLVLGSIG